MVPTVHEDLCSFMIIFYAILRRMKNVSNKDCRGKQDKHFIFNNGFSKNCSIRDIIRKNMVGPGRTRDNIIRRTRIACWITLATDTHNQNTLIAFPRQQWLRERVAMLRYSTLPVFLELIVVLVFQLYLGRVTYILMRA